MHICMSYIKHFKIIVLNYTTYHMFAKYLWATYFQVKQNTSINYPEIPFYNS